MESLNKKTDSVLIQMLQSKPIVLSTATTNSHRHATKRSTKQPTIDGSDEDDVMILDEPRRWTKKRRLLAKYEKKCSSGGEDDSGTEPGSSSSSSGSPSDGEFNCECTNDSGCDDEDEEEKKCEHENHKDHIDELCWQLEENFKENDGFFRRSIQQKIQYRPCTKNQQCMIQRVNRNRCQYCRLKKCIAVGMSRDDYLSATKKAPKITPQTSNRCPYVASPLGRASVVHTMNEDSPILRGILRDNASYPVRFGRVPKREKARIEAAMQQSTRNRALTTHVWTDGIEDIQHIIDTVVGAHMETCEFTRERVREMKLRAKDCPNYTEPTRACPLNPAPEIQSEQEFSQRFADVIRGVIEFAGKIPGFDLLAQGDKFTLLKAGLFDALFVRLIGMFDTSMDSIVCLNGQLMRRDSIQNGANARFLVDSTFKFAERINAMQLTDAEVALFCAVVLIAPDRHGIRNYDLIQRMHSKMRQCLQQIIVKTRPNEPEFMANLMNTIGDLKTLSTLHTEKLVVFRNEMSQQLSSLNNENLQGQQIQVTDVSTHQKPTHHNSASQQPLHNPPTPINGHHNNTTHQSPPHHPTIRMCPRIMDAQSSDGSMQTITSSEPSPPPQHHQQQQQMCPAKQSPILLAKLQGCPMGYQSSKARESPISHPNIPAGTTITAVTRPMPAGPIRKLDSPTDSGIESGSDGSSVGGHKIGSGSSSCSSPRSSLEDTPMMTPSLAESLPTLKRALEKPAIFDPHMYHKKFRRCLQNEAGSPPMPMHEPSQLQTILTAPRNGHLAMTHSNLVDRLKMAPKMSEEHRKNQELLNRFIDQGGVIKSTAKVHISAAPMVDNEGAPLNLSKKTTTIVINSNGNAGAGTEADTKIMLEA
ncbi:hypothetical protein PVAND_015392 [Polypedilum vanderplanki]|uniref:Uncharacterized protein n=1 Tax=Polypedilum vanderplanki TaxID=319348 RepID=A0A9J6BCZ1_POLVA|nr:hypothetical protein PVAND_015392 [Polypedilum vanderplanki]